MFYVLACWLALVCGYLTVNHWHGAVVGLVIAVCMIIMGAYFDDSN